MGGPSPERREDRQRGPHGGNSVKGLRIEGVRSGGKVGGHPGSNGAGQRDIIAFRSPGSQRSLNPKMAVTWGENEIGPKGGENHLFGGLIVGKK